MTPYAATRVNADDQELLARIRQATQDLPDGLAESDHTPITVSCHMLARAVATVFDLKHKYGYFYLPSHLHSWCVTPDGNIVDAYPIGILGGPLLVDRNAFATTMLYVPMRTEDIAQMDFGSASFRRQTAVVTHALRRAITQRPLPIV